MSHKSPCNVATQEKNYKLRSRWYRTPSKIHKFFPHVSDRCWRCGSARGSLLHIWWECPPITDFWKKVHTILKTVTTCNLTFTPACLLLHHIQEEMSLYRKSAAVHMVNVAKRLIPMHWRKPEAQCIRERLRRIDVTAEMDEFIHISQDRHTKCIDTWATWQHFKTTQEYS